jgi:RND family efflux transporter MFP subunit
MKTSTLSWLSAGVITLSVATISYYLAADLPNGAVSQKRFEVQPIDFDLTIVERGVIRPAKVEPIKSKISSNQAQTVWVYGEGKSVNKGFIVARFDTKPFMDKLQKAQQDLADAEASLLAAEKALELQDEQETSKIEAAKRKLEIAQIKAQDLKEGSGRLKRRKLVQAMEQAERSASMAAAELDDFEALLQKGHVSQRERDKIADQRRTAKDALDMAQAELKNFDRFEWPRLLREAQLIVEAEKTDQERVKRTAELEIQRRQGDVVKFQRAVNAAKRARNLASQDVENCDVRAPIDGTLLYVELPKEGGRRKLQIGDAIWFGQTFMEIPDTRDMIVEFSVREVDIVKLRLGMKVSIKVDALSKQRFAGALIAIDTLAETDQRNSLSEFRATARFDTLPETLHVGMSANVEIPYQQYHSTLAVPLRAITYVDGQAQVSVVSPDGGIAKRVLDLGGMSAQWVEVRRGLAAGESLLLDAF